METVAAIDGQAAGSSLLLALSLNIRKFCILSDFETLLTFRGCFRDGGWNTKVEKIYYNRQNIAFW